jgi:hypothetical protein
MAVFWVVEPCSLVEVYQCFRGPCCRHHQGDEDPLLIALMIEAARTSETLVNFCQTTWRYNSEDSHLSRVPLDNTIVAQLVKIYSYFYGTQKFIVMFTSPPVTPILSQMNPVHNLTGLERCTL